MLRSRRLGPTLVTGATGLVGAHVAAALVADGAGPRALVRDPSAAARRPELAHAELVRGDLDEPASLAGACRGCTAVVHAAALTDGDPASVERTNAAGTRALLDEARRAGVARFVFVSTVAVYRDGPLVRAVETHPRGGGSPYARSKERAEDRVLAAGGMVVRAPAVYGPGDRHYLPELEHAVRHRAIPLDPSGGALRDLVHAADLARGLIGAAGAGFRGRAVFHVAGPAPVRAVEVAGVVGEALGVAPLFFEVPADLPLEGAVPDAWVERTRALARPPIPWHQAPAALVERTVDDARARRELGWAPRVGLREGVISALRLRSAGDEGGRP